MKRLEIKEFGLKSLFKVSIYIMIVPMILLFILGVILTLIALTFKIYEILPLGIIYSLLPIAAIPLYGAIYMLVGFVYNALSKRFGGLEVTIEENE